jgi:hypothetical protein
VALDPGWSAIIGAAVGSLGTLGVGALERMGRRHAEDREDHIRDLDRRRELYARCIEVEREHHHAVADIVLDLRVMGIGADESDREEMRSARTRFTELSAQVDLTASESVRKAYEALSREMSTLTTAVELVADKLDRHMPVEGDVAVRVRQINESDGDLGVLAEFNRLADAMTNAMRADLRIREPAG